MIIVGLFFEGMAVLLVFVLLAVLGHGRSRRRQGMIVPASAAPHGSRAPRIIPICREPSLLVRYDLVTRYDAAGA
jgi:hypothetical protein